MGVRAGVMALESAFAAAKLLDPDVAVTITATALDKKLKFRGDVLIGATAYTVADAKGKIKSFGDVDDLVKLLSGVLPTSSGDYVVNVVTGALLIKPLPGDMVKAAQSEVGKLTAAKTAALAVVTGLDASLALMVGWESGNVLQVARKTETLAQKTAVLDEIVAVEAEIARLTAIIGGGA